MPQTLSVLVVDDDPVVHLIATEILGPGGHRVRHAEDGVQAIRRMSEAPAEVVLLDMLMPNKEGMETLVEIRARWPQARVVVISGGGRIDAHELLEWARIAGADATLIKPLDPARLLEALTGAAAPTPKVA